MFSTLSRSVMLRSSKKEFSMIASDLIEGKNVNKRRVKNEILIYKYRTEEARKKREATCAGADIKRLNEYKGISIESFLNNID